MEELIIKWGGVLGLYLAILAMLYNFYDKTRLKIEELFNCFWSKEKYATINQKIAMLV